MSFVVTIWVREGIVLASDSRLTMNSKVDQGNHHIHNIAVGQSDSNYKTFLCPNTIGINTFGDAAIGGIPIGGFIESFIEENFVEPYPTVASVASELLAYFRRLNANAQTRFHVAGYEPQDGGTSILQVYDLNVSENSCSQVVHAGQPGASWGGQGDVLARLIQPMFSADQNGNPGERLPDVQIPFQFFTLQDAIDFAVFAIRSTIDSIRFQPRPKTVGGPIDVLVLKPSGAQWIQRKSLKVV